MTSKRFFLPILLILTAVFFIIAGCDHDNHNHPELTTGEDFYLYHCANCHGDVGTGEFLQAVPANIVTTMSCEQLSWFIRSEHDAYPDMPVFSAMSAQEARLIACHVKKLQEEFFILNKYKNKLLLERQNR